MKVLRKKSHKKTRKKTRVSRKKTRVSRKKTRVSRKKTRVSRKKTRKKTRVSRKKTRVSRKKTRKTMKKSRNTQCPPRCVKTRKKSRRVRKVSRKKSRRVRKVSRKGTNKSKKMVTCSKLKGMRNIGNTCYMDSVLFPMIALPSKYIRSTILGNQTSVENPGDTEKEKKRKRTRRILKNSLVKLYRSMRKDEETPTVKKVKKAFKRCPSKFESNYSDYGQEDAGEFLQTMADVFGLNDMKRQLTVYGTNDISPIPSNDNLVVSSNREEIQSIIQQVTVEQLRHGRVNTPVKIGSFLQSVDDSGELDISNSFTPEINGKVEIFKRRIAKTEVVDTPYLVFYIIRQGLMRRDKDGNIKFRRDGMPHINPSIYRKVVDPSETLTLPSKRVLMLTSIVLHLGSTIASGHYILYFKCDGEWLVYDDLGTGFVKIGSFSKMLQRNPNPKTYGTLFYYT
jgi:ubiquitin C-terminal hydrolase